MKNIIILVVLIIFSSCFQDSGRYYHIKGLANFETGNYEEAIEDFTKGISIDDIHVNLNYLGRVEVYRKLEKFALAYLDIQKVLETEKTNSDNINRNAYWQLALLEQNRGEKGKELESYRKALEYDPDEEGLRMTYGLVLIESGFSQEGVDVLNELINENYEHPYILNNRALGYIKLKKYGQAEEDLQKSLETDAKNPFVYKNYALLYAATNQPDLACQHISKALSLDIMEYGVRKHIFEFKKLESKFCS